MGLRVRRKAPLVTRDDVAMGPVELILVLARQKKTMPARPKTRPTEARTRATDTRRPDGTSAGATSEDTSHMRTPKSSAAAGGTFSSSEFMAAKVGHNAKAHRRAGAQRNCRPVQRLVSHGRLGHGRRQAT